MKTYKVEVKLSDEQKLQYSKTIGVCRYVYNLFVQTNTERHEKGLKYMSNYEFSKWLNNEYIPNDTDKAWIKEVSSKAVRSAIDNADKAFKRFFNEKKGYPKYKKKDLKLKDRVYVCEHCGLVIDRDVNASINLREAKAYTQIA